MGPVPRRLPGWRPLAAALPPLAFLPSTSAAQPMPTMPPLGCVEDGDNRRFHLVPATEPKAPQERMPEEPPSDDTPLGARTKGFLNLDAAGGAQLLNLTSTTPLSDRCEP